MVHRLVSNQRRLVRIWPQGYLNKKQRDTRIFIIEGPKNRIKWIHHDHILICMSEILNGNPAALILANTWCQSSQFLSSRQQRAQRYIWDPVLDQRPCRLWKKEMKTCFYFEKKKKGKWDTYGQFSILLESHWYNSQEKASHAMHNAEACNGYEKKLLPHIRSNLGEKV